MTPRAEHLGRTQAGDELLRIVCELDSAELRDAQDPTRSEQWIHVMPLGPSVEARDGRRFTMRDATEVVRATELPMLVDWEHASEHGDTRAAGWVEELRIEPESSGSRAGLWGRVKWTPQGREHVATQHYRFLSPVVLGKRALSEHKRLEFHVDRLASVALTNRPALRMHGIESFREQLSVRFGPITSEDSMDKLKRALCSAFGLAADADEDALIAAVSPAIEAAKQTSSPSGTEALREALSTITKERNEALALLDKREQELDTYRASSFQREVEVFFAEGARAGKIPPAAREKWLSFALKTPDNFTLFREEIFPGLPTLLTERAPKSRAKRAELAARSEHGVDRAALKQLGLTDEQILESEREVFGARARGPGDEEPEEDQDDAGDEPAETEAANAAAQGG